MNLRVARWLSDMLGFFLFVGGAIICLLVLYDFLRTAISFSGLGPISSAVRTAFWHVLIRIAVQSERRLGRSMRGLIGPIILSAIALSWISCLMLGYALLFSAGGSLSDPETGAAATGSQIFAFSGSVLSTLGASSVSPTNGWWDILSMIAAVNGMIVLTLSVSFVLSIRQTTMAVRSLATRYRALAASGADLSEDRAVEHAKGLGAEMCNVAVQLTASPLPGVFIPDDPEMDFAEVVRELCDLLEDRGLAYRGGELDDEDLAELRWGLGLLGRHYRKAEEVNDFQSARQWAKAHSLPEI